MPNTTPIIVPTSTPPRTRAGLCLLAGLAAAASLWGCASAGESETAAANSGAALKPAPGEARADLAEAIARDAEALSKLLREGGAAEQQAAAPPAEFPGATFKQNRKPAPGAADAAARANISTALDTGADAATPVLASPAPTPSKAAAEPPATLDQRIERLSAELAARLRERSEKNVAPFYAALSLANLEFLAPTSAAAFEPSSALSADEAAALSAWRSALRQLASDLTSPDSASSAGGGVGAMSRAVAGLQQGLGIAPSLTIAQALLCSRVEGFGRYTPLPSTSLLAGKRHRAIVYAEVDGFAHKASTGSDGEPAHTVELTQDISLYHDADGLLAWRRPEQDISDTSRNRRRDFFVVQMIELPETLTVGAYRLKVTMRDKNTGAVAESIVPVQIVADAALTRGK